MMEAPETVMRWRLNALPFQEQYRQRDLPVKLRRLTKKLSRNASKMRGTSPHPSNALEICAQRQVFCPKPVVTFERHAFENKKPRS
jgi:hypothetical protein